MMTKGFKTDIIDLTDDTPPLQKAQFSRVAPFVPAPKVRWYLNVFGHDVKMRKRRWYEAELQQGDEGILQANKVVLVILKEGATWIRESGYISERVGARTASITHENSPPTEGDMQDAHEAVEDELLVVRGRARTHLKVSYQD